MSILSKLSPHLPYIRRYARALTGGLALGDIIVRHLLEDIAEGEITLSSEMPARVALYRALHHDLHISDSTNENEAECSSAQTLLARQVFMLRTLESFTADEAAKIIEIEPAQAQKLFDIGMELSKKTMSSFDALIIEDEPIVAADLEALVKELGFNIIDIAATTSEALVAAKRKPPHLILADIQLADGSSGIDAVKRILERQKAVVLFITGFPERLLSGERPEPAFLITKPYQPETFKAAITQAFFMQSAGPFLPVIKWRSQPIEREPQPDRGFRVTAANETKPVQIAGKAKPKSLKKSGKTPSRRGFAAMDKDRQREIARKGGASVPDEKRSFSQDRDLAAAAGRKGGEASHGGGRTIRPGTGNKIKKPSGPQNG